MNTNEYLLGTYNVPGIIQVALHISKLLVLIMLQHGYYFFLISNEETGRHKVSDLLRIILTVC